MYPNYLTKLKIINNFTVKYCVNKYNIMMMY